MGISGRPTRALAAAVAGVVLAFPASALAADTFVDADTGLDTNPCTLALPCLTIQEGIDEATADATVHVDPDSYPLGLQIGNGKSLVADEFVGGPEGNASIDGGGSPALDVPASGAGTVSGFSITSTTSPVIDVKGPIDLRGNSIHVLGQIMGVQVMGIDVTAGPAGLVTIADNDFLGDSTNGQRAINLRGGSEASVTSNRIGSPGSAFLDGIIATEGATAEIARNTLRAFFSIGSAGGQPILVQDASATITGNVVRHTQASPDVVSGIAIFDTATAPDTVATLRRNQLYGGGAGDGIRILGRPSVTLEGDLATGFETGIVAQDLDFVLPRPAVDAAGVTAFGNDADDIKLVGFDLTLDSSIVGLPVDLSGPGLECAITYSRGPTTDPGGHSCTVFQTSAPPGFVDESPMFGEPDLHLTAGSAMLDAGNPAPPSPTALDIDGQPRALDGDEECPEERIRDIGADEFGAPLDCDPPETRIKGKKRTTKERARFKLRSDEEGSTFRCKLDRRRYRRCKPRYKTPKLDPGKHKLKAKATDAAGNEDPSAAVSGSG